MVLEIVKMVALKVEECTMEVKVRPGSGTPKNILVCWDAGPC